MAKIKLLFRNSLAEDGEIEIAKKYFDVIESRCMVESGDVVISRYSSLPFREELDRDIKYLGGTLLNSQQEFNFVANFEWYSLLSDLTPKTWFSLQEVLSDPYEGPYVLKGKTNSRKHLWKTHMYAKDKDDLRKVYFKLLDDSLIGDQGIIVREFELFKNYGQSIVGAPITKEFRFFIYKSKAIAKGFYWCNYPEVEEEFKPDVAEVPAEFLEEVIGRVKSFVGNLWVVDVAQREDGRWRVVELNTGEMSGLSSVDAEELYSNLSSYLR